MHFINMYFIFFSLWLNARLHAKMEVQLLVNMSSSKKTTFFYKNVPLIEAALDDCTTLWYIIFIFSPC